MRKNIVPPFIIYCRSDRQRKPNGGVYLTTFWLFRLRAPDEKDYKTVLAFFAEELAEERIKFSSILVGISVLSSTQCQCSFYFFVVWRAAQN
jgi:hypothetical protein